MSEVSVGMRGSFIGPSRFNIMEEGPLLSTFVERPPSERGVMATFRIGERIGAFTCQETAPSGDICPLSGPM